MLLGEATRIAKDGRPPEPALMPLDMAIAFVLAGATPVEGTEAVEVARGRGRILAVPVAAPHALPRFDNSAMDGYALAGSSARHRLVGRAVAGRPFRGRLRDGEAVRILTGAAVPAGATAIVMQEDAEVVAGAVRCLRAPEDGANIRRAGEDIAPSETVLYPGTRLDARHVALLSALGVSTVPVRRGVRVGILSTGTELVRPGGALSDGAIFDSNRTMLLACLDLGTVSPIDLGIVPDHPAFLAATLLEASRETDLIVTSGGVSAGDEDHLADAILRAGGEVDRLRIALKPGKPLAFGRIGNTRIVGLPGNPVATLAAFLLVARPLLDRLAGLPRKPLALQAAVAGFPRKAETARTEVLPVFVSGHDPHGRPILDLAGPTGAARLRPLLAADGFCILPPHAAPLEPGDRADYLSLAEAGIG